MQLSLEMQQGILLYRCTTVNEALPLVTPQVNSWDHMNQDV